MTTDWSCSAYTHRSSPSSRTSAWWRRRSATGIDYPVAVDNDYAVWNAFDNHYWPAVYLVDAEGKRRGHHFGEGGYEEVEGAIQRLLGRRTALATAAGGESRRRRTGITCAAPRPISASRRSNRRLWIPDRRATTSAGRASRSTTGRMVGTGPSGPSTCCSSVLADRGVPVPRSRRTFVLSSAPGGADVPFRVLVDGAAPGPDHGVDVDAEGSAPFAKVGCTSSSGPSPR